MFKKKTAALDHTFQWVAEIGITPEPDLLKRSETNAEVLRAYSLLCSCHLLQNKSVSFLQQLSTLSSDLGALTI